MHGRRSRGMFVFMPKNVVNRDIRAYFEDTVVPLIAREHPEVVAQMSIRVEGSVGLGLNDELSDMDAMIYLPKDLWRTHGGQLQLDLIHSLEPFSAHNHPYCENPGDPFAWARFGHAEVNVHPRSELLCGHSEEVVTGEKDVPWDEVSVEELHQIQHSPILCDSGGFLTRIKDATAVDRYPVQLWTKRLIYELAEFKGEPWDLQKAVRRGRTLETQMILGTVLAALFRVTYLINKRYYPWRKYLFPLFGELPFGPPEIQAEFENIASGGDWHRKSASVDRILRVLTEQILKNGMLSADVLEYLFPAKNGRAWENPNWRDEYDRKGRMAREAGYDSRDGWIWGFWGWNEDGVQPDTAVDTE